MPASLLEPVTAAPGAGHRAAAPAGARACGRCPRCAGRRWRPRCSRPGWPPTSRMRPGAGWPGRSSWPATRPAAGSRAWPGCGRCGAEGPGRGPADGGRGDRRRRGRAGPGRRPADRHLRHLRRAGGGGHPPHRAGRARPARPGPRRRPSGSATDGTEEVVDAASLRIGDVILVRPGERIAADGQVLVRRQRRGPGHDHRRAAAGRQAAGRRGVRRHPQRRRRAAGPGRPGRRRQRGRPDRRHGRGGRPRPRPAPSCSSRRSSSATPSAWSPPPCCCSRSRCSPGAAFQPTLLRAMTFMIVASPCAVVLATMPPLLAAMANAGPARRAGQVRRGDGAGSAPPPGSRSTRPAPSPRAPRGWPRSRSCPAPAWTEQEHPRAGRGGREPVRAPAGPRRSRRRPRRRADPRQAPRVHRRPGPRRHRARVAGRRVEIGSPAPPARPDQPHHAAAAPSPALEETGQTAAVVRIDGQPGRAARHRRPDPRPPPRPPSPGSPR